MSSFKEGRSRLLNYIWLLACIAAVCANIMIFVLMPRILSPLSIILSNLITLVFTALALKPANNLLEDALTAKLEQKLRAEEELRRQISTLENENRALETRNRELSDKLDTRAQTDSLPTSVNFTFKVEHVEFAKKGYVVKEEDLDFMDPEKFRLPGKTIRDAFLEGMKLREPGLLKVLYIHKFYYKASIGIDFTTIKYAYDTSGGIIFSGVNFTKLHDTTSELERDPDDIDRCEILRITPERTEIRSDKSYEDFKEEYRYCQECSVKESLAEEVEKLCSQYTSVFRDSIRKTFSGVLSVEFTDEPLESSKLDWFILSGTKDGRVAQVGNSMLLLSNLMNETQKIGKPTIGQIGEDFDEQPIMAS